jgi:hypothetical protein
MPAKVQEFKAAAAVFTILGEKSCTFQAVEKV